MPKRPLVSVIIPAYNAAPFIRQTLQSVLRQTYTNLEVLVIDDGSRDNTAEIVDEVAATDDRVILLRQPNQGVAAARNHGIAKSSGEFIAPIDADDIWFPEKIERQVQCMMEGGPDVGLVYTWWAAIDEAGLIYAAAEKWDIEGSVYKALIYVNFIGNASVPLIRRACIEEVGGYDTSLGAQNAQGCEDWDLSLRIAERYQFRVVPAYLTGYRSVAHSMSWNCASMGRSYDLIARNLERKHPGFERDLLRWSRSRFYHYLASLSYNQGKHGETLRWISRSLRWDASAVLSIGLLKLIIKSLIRFAARPLTALIWPDHRVWLAFKRRFPASQRKSFTLDELEADVKKTCPWVWRFWKPYDRICIQRWRHITLHRSASTLPVMPKKVIARTLSSRWQAGALLEPSQTHPEGPIHYDRG